jgi:rhamnose utilization protein RhaD (predicted bifunctional aldolase and dehydrogenase)/NAD(P)-dependent dehydrogenase (short-subunit alcohol dehydrogenase family)
MKSLWSDPEAREFVDRLGPAHGEDLALRVYTSRLIGRESALVLHGGGNTSVKTRARTILGAELDVIRVKGSGWDLASIEPAGLPALELAPLLALRELDALSDDEMVNQQRIRLLDSRAPTPSVETLLHAFVPRRFVDHTHADAILILTNQPDGEAMVREALGERVSILPWILPGFPLAKAVAEAYERDPECEGIALLKHGIFTFDDDARASYEKMIALVDRAERYALQRSRGRVAMLIGGDGESDPAELAAAALPVLRGALALPDGSGGWQRMVASWRRDRDLIAFAGHPDCRGLLEQGPLTPNHIIRTKGSYLVLGRDEARDPDAVRRAVAAYADRYRAYFEANKGRMSFAPKMLDPHPRVVVVEGAGVFAFGADRKAADIAGDIAEHTLRSKALAAAIGTYADLSAGELFEMEYWPLEQAKLGKKQASSLAGRVALVTGAAGAIGCGIAEALLEAGAHVMLTDLDAQRLERVVAKLGSKHSESRIAHSALDVTDSASVRAAFAQCALAFGGVDVVVPNAGIAYVSKLEDMDPARFAKVVDVNLTGTMLVLKEAARVFALQRTGGAVVIQASKNVFDPGAGFGAYSASKAGAHQLGKIAALELAPLGVTVNMVNADAVFGDDEVPSGLWQEVGPDRMRARGLDARGLRDYYRERSLLKVEVRPEHVGRAVVFFASGATPTTGATLPVDAGIPGAFPR